MHLVAEPNRPGLHAGEQELRKEAKMEVASSSQLCCAYMTMAEHQETRGPGAASGRTGGGRRRDGRAWSSRGGGPGQLG
jgi:hypothetical protein